jgi:hypothetical protein
MASAEKFENRPLGPTIQFQFIPELDSYRPANQEKHFDRERSSTTIVESYQARHARRRFVRDLSS